MDDAIQPEPYRHLGSDTEVSHVGRFLNFGQQATFPGGHADARASGGAFLPENAFWSIGFTEAEVEQWSNPADHEYIDTATNQLVAGAPEEFLAKKRRAIELMRKIQSGEIAPDSFPSNTPPDTANSGVE